MAGFRDSAAIDQSWLREPQQPGVPGRGRAGTDHTVLAYDGVSVLRDVYGANGSDVFQCKHPELPGRQQGDQESGLGVDRVPATTDRA